MVLEKPIFPVLADGKVSPDTGLCTVTLKEKTRWARTQTQPTRTNQILTLLCNSDVQPLYTAMWFILLEYKAQCKPW